MRPLRCPLCNRDFQADTMACHAGCPVSGHCRVLCCPHCGYQFPDENVIRQRVSRLQDLSRNLMRSVFGRAPEANRPGRAPRAEKEAGVIPLTELPAGAECVIVRVESRHRTRTDRLAAYGVTPGTVLTLQQKFPTFVVRVAETDLALDEEVASDVLVRPRTG